MSSPTVLHRLKQCPSTIAREHTHTHTHTHSLSLSLSLLNNIMFAITGAAVSVTFFKSVPFQFTCAPLICDQTFEYFVVSGDLEKELNCL
jgi:hypothetical protein